MKYSGSGKMLQPTTSTRDKQGLRVKLIKCSSTRDTCIYIHMHTHTYILHRNRYIMHIKYTFTHMYIHTHTF